MSDLFSSSDSSIGQFIRHYRQSLLGSSGGILLSEFDNDYKVLTPLIHSGVNSSSPDLGGLSYAQNRLPGCIGQINKIIFVSNLDIDPGIFDINTSQKVFSPARRRLIYFDGQNSARPRLFYPALFFPDRMLSLF